MRFQQQDNSLIEIATEKPGSSKMYSHIYRHRIIVIPKQILKSLLEWYHNVLCHPGKTRTELTIGQHFYWKGLQKSVDNICSKYHMYQFLKQDKTKLW